MSRESLLLANNVLLVVAAAIGAARHAVSAARSTRSDLGKISVGPPYFDTVFVPLMAPRVFLMGVGPIARWKQRARCPTCATRLRWALGVALVAGAAAAVRARAAGRRSSRSACCSPLWVVAATVAAARAAPAQRAAARPRRKLRAQPRAWYGMLLAHLGVAVFIVGVTLVKGYEIERDVRMTPGDSVDVGGYAFRSAASRRRAGPELHARARRRSSVARDGKPVATLHPREARLPRVAARR